jgi:hypothetical protein
MTAGILNGTLRFMTQLDEQLKLQASLEGLGAALTAIVGSPANPSLQTNLGTSMDAFTEATQKMSAAITPSRAMAIEEIGGKEFYDPGMAALIRHSVQTNAMTPSVARDMVQDLASRRSTFLETLRSTLQGLNNLNIREEVLESGKADVSFVIPRDIFENDLHEFVDELRFIDRMVGHLNEAIRGERGHVPLRSLASSDPTVGLELAANVVGLIGKIVGGFLVTWKAVAEIKSIWERMKQAGIGSKHAAAEIEEEIKTKVDETVEESTKMVMIHYKGDPSRRNEIENAIRLDTKALYSRIERGMVVDVRANPDTTDADEETRQALDEVANLSGTLVFPPASRGALLLESPKLFNGEGVLVAKQETKVIKKSTETTVKKKKKADSGDGAKPE